MHGIPSDYFTGESKILSGAASLPSGKGLAVNMAEGFPRDHAFLFHSIFSYYSPMSIQPVYMYLFHRDGWYCQFLEADLKTSLPRKLTFASADKVRDLAERGGGLKKLEDKQVFEYALTIGRGGVNLMLTEEQYAKLIR